jgi:carboxyl-terminal processing protease
MAETTNRKKLLQKNLITIGLVVLIFLAGFGIGTRFGQTGNLTITGSLTGKGTTNQVANFATFWRAWDLLVHNFDGKIDYQKMIDGSISGMTDSLGDPYTVYMNATEAKALSDDLSGTISGIGAEVGIKDGKVTIIAPIDNSPAKKAGIAPGDVILKINDESTTGMALGTAIQKIRGEAGTKVKLNIQHGAESKELTITREKFTVQNIKSEIKPGNIGYVSISRFDQNTSAELRKVLEDFKSKGVTKVILDLRDNPGGYLNQSVEVASEFIDSGVIVSERKSVSNSAGKNYKATGDGTYTDEKYKLVVLTNGGSASASEIVAGALKDHKRATLVGEKTFGKGSVQEIKDLANGAQLKITVAHWFTPNGKNISKEGITPDYTVVLTDADYSASKDPQLVKALQLLQN